MCAKLRSILDLSDEIIAMIVYHLEDPGPFSATAKSFYEICKDPYVRSSYFLHRYGPQHAFYYALSRGKLLNDKVLNILSTSGAHFSRYLLQVAIHHYFRTTSHFIKAPWVRNLSLGTFTHFMSLGSRYGMEIALAKGEDDGSLFQAWLKERSTPGLGRKIELEVIKDLFQKYGFMIFSPKDPLATQLPLAFALEPTLVPLALANGFHLDPKYRDYIFRKIFEKNPECHNNTERANEIVKNVRDMKRVDKKMFLSRTVAAEICMECRTNFAAYVALKKLEAAGDLLFSMKDLVHDLLRLFLRTRSIIHPPTVLTIQELYRDFSPTYSSSSPRLVVLITVFCTPPSVGLVYADAERSSGSTIPRVTRETLKAKLEHLGVLPLTKRDLLDILISPWCERLHPLLLWARVEMEMTEKELFVLAEEAALKSLGTSCKGKLIKCIVETYGTIRDSIEAYIERDHRVHLHDIPDCWTDAKHERYSSALNTGFGSTELFQVCVGRLEERQLESDSDDDSGDEIDDAENNGAAGNVVMGPIEDERVASKRELGLISQDTLTARIAFDEENAVRRRRFWHTRYFSSDTQWRLPCPPESLLVGRWALDTYGPRHRVTAIFMDHAIVNSNHTVLRAYLDENTSRVPVTFKHFQIMARLGVDSCWHIWNELTRAEFYLSEEDYLTPGANSSGAGPSRRNAKSSSKMFIDSPDYEDCKAAVVLERPQTGRKRPRRSATMAASYVIPGSDDDGEGFDREYDTKAPSKRKGKLRATETDLQLWIRHLTALLKEEERKYKDKKKTVPRDEITGKPMYRLPKTDFMRQLTTRLSDLRLTERQRRYQVMMADINSGSESMKDSDEEYRPAPKRRRMELYE
ncbi:hypothetical protein M422DRAFT_221215 [Sphaerobolus stellatus SS14]|nr:hypothetical protein M422DRAFT_221215 [Sphaerobolus stellatus SS14]